MTYVEAAVEVLREAGRPLHFKKITEAAVKRDILSHVGRSPEEAMRVRLEAEAKRPAPANVIEEVRPGVFGLREGVDPDVARQTIALHQPDLDDTPEPEPVIADGEVDENGDPVEVAVVEVAAVASDEAAPAASTPAGEGEQREEGRRRRRGRRGGRRRQEGSGDADGASSAAGDDGDDDGDAENDSGVTVAVNGEARDGDEPAPSVRAAAPPAPRSAPAADAQPPRGRHERQPRSESAPAATDDLPPVASAVFAILSRRSDPNPLSASRIADELAKAGVGAVGVLGTSGLRSTLGEANARRAAEGRPPVFEETKPNFWTLAAASGSSLAKSYAALEQWQARHRAALIETLLQKLDGASAASLGTVVTLLLDRTGHAAIRSYPGDSLTLSARSPRGLTEVVVAVRVFAAGRRVDRDSVAAFRGGLHNYGAAEGVILAFGAVEPSAPDETNVPNVAPISILDRRQIAERLVASGVGIARFSVDVSCIDDAFMRELRG